VYIGVIVYILVGLYPGSALSPYLFAIVMDKLAKCMQDDMPWHMLFANNVVLIDDIEGDDGESLEV